MKKKQTKKQMVLASALVMGMAVFASIQAGAAETVKKEVYETQLDKTKNINYRQTFEEFLEVSGLKISDKDKARLKTLYEEGKAKYDPLKSDTDYMDKFFEALEPYYK